MLRKAILISASLVAMAAAAHAARWGVSVSVAPNKDGITPAVSFSPAQLSGALVGGRGFYTFSSNQGSVDLTVSPATGYKVTNVKVGTEKKYFIPVGTTPTDATYNVNTPQTVTVTKPATLATRPNATRVVVATAIAAPLRYNVTTDRTQAGFKMTAGYKNVVYGTSGKKVRITPTRGYKITAINVSGTSYTAVTKSGAGVTGGTGGDGSVTVAAPKGEYIELTLGAITGHVNITATAEFQYWANAVVTAGVRGSSTMTQKLAYFADPDKAIILSASQSSSSTPAATYTWAVPAGATVETKPAAANGTASTTAGIKTAYFRATAVGTYPVTLTIADGGVTDTATYTIVVENPVTTTGCTGCHTAKTDSAGVFVNSAVKASAHYVGMSSATSPKANVCAACHGNHDASFATLVRQPTNVCVDCHTGAKVAHGGYVPAADCVGCHNPHSAAATAFKHSSSVGNTVRSCATCHAEIAATFATSQHGTREGKATWYNDNVGNPSATELQKGFGNYVNTAYTTLPCGKCHNAAAWTPAGGTDQWAAADGGKSVCIDCHGNRSANVNTTRVTAPVAKSTCFGCHSRQANEASAGLTDVHFVAGMGCPSCHSTADFHGTGTQTASQLEWGTISAQCENCHGEGKARGAISSIAEHVQHAGNIACSTCHAESMITCHNCHFDNEAGAGGALKAKFFSGKFGGTVASGNSWRYLVNRVMPDGSTKVYPGSMQSLVADYTVDGANDAAGHTHAGIAPYYSHTITRTNALRCAGCHGTENAVKLAAGVPVRVTTWNAAAGVSVPAASVATTFTGPKGVIPVPENPRGKLLMDFVDLTNPELGTASNRVLFQKDGPDTIHMPEAFVKPLTAAQMDALAMPYREGATTAAAAHADGFIGSNDLTEHTSCAGCHVGTAATFTTSQHGTRQGKATWYNDNVGNAAATELQKGFGNYVNVAYTALPCGKCHNAAAWTPAGGTDQWAASTGGVSVCTDCHGNKAAAADTTTVYAPVTKATCFGCHSRQANESAAGLSDVHFVAGMLCKDCHSTTDFHGTGKQAASQLEWGTISAQCENCHGEGKSRGPISQIAAHVQHAANIACSTCHAESMITCHNCHFDNEAGAGGALKAKFFSGRFGGTHASGNSWRYLVNRVMPDGSTKIYPGSMQSLVADYTVDGANDAAGHTHAGIAPYYSHTITRANALSCDKCHGTETAVKLAAGQPVRVTTWNAAAGVAVPAANVATTFVGPKGVIPVPENPRGLLLMDFVDLTDPSLGTASPRVLFQKDGPDTIHMPEAFVKPLTAEQMQKLAAVQFDHTSAVASAAPTTGFTANTCNGCHASTNASYAQSQHFTKNGKATWFNDHLGNTDPALDLQTGFGTYVTVQYTELPCMNCHNGNDNGPWDKDPAAGVNVQDWPGPNCTECHTNRTTYGVQTTTFDAPVTKATCYGCHSRQKKEAAPVASGGAGLVDVHTNGVDDDGDGQTEDLTCMGCHSLTDVHGSGTLSATQLQWGTISAKCDNCHGVGKQQGAVSTLIPEHDTLHLGKLDCSTCHVESVVTCNNCHFDNEMGGTGIRKLKFASGFFGGLYNADPALNKSWRYLLNRVMPDGSTKVYPGSMQSLYTDVYAKNAPGSGAVAGQGDDTGWSHAGIAPYYSHSITRVNALKCDRCHGVQNAIDLANGTAIRVVTWTGADTDTVAPSSLGTLLKGPKGVVPVPENPKGKLLMDFVDLVDPNAALNATSDNIVSYRKLAQRNGPNSIHIPEAYARPLTAAQINALATPQVRP